MFIIGLTGGIGSGKSAAAKILKELGLKVIDLDQITHELMMPSEPGYEEIKKEFGEKYIDTKGAIDRKLLREDIFSSFDLKKRIESILHPIIFEECNKQLNLLKQGNGIVQSKVQKKLKIVNLELLLHGCT